MLGNHWIAGETGMSIPNSHSVELCAADILLTPPPPPIITDRRATAADRMSATRRRLFLWLCSRHVVHQLYVARFCNAVYSLPWTLTKSSKNDAGVFCNSPWYPNETQRRKSKSVFVGNFMKMKADATCKCLVWNFLANLVNTADGTVKDFNSV